MPKQNKNLLAAAIGAALIPGTSSVVEAGNVQPMFQTGNGNTRIGLHFDVNERDMKQKNSRQRIGSLAVTEYDEEFFSGEGQTFQINRSLGDMSAEERQQHLYLQISHAVTPRIDLYGRVGIARTKLTDLKGRTTFDLGYSEYDLGGTYLDETERVDGGFTERGGHGSTSYSDVGILAGLGASFVLHTWGANNAWQLGLDLSYQYKRQHSGDRLEKFPFAPFQQFATEEGIAPSVDHITSQEAQAALTIGRTIGNFRPYGGIKYAYQKTEMDVDGGGSWDYQDIGGNGEIELMYHDASFEFENKDRIGYFLGFDYTVAPGFSIGAQGRFGDDVGGNIGFSVGY